jgi:glyoxylase-like metal-dependent hydrolase (beta-lactamase superfamily II)
MYFQRFYLDCLAHASYLLADEKTKVAAVIDPQRDVDIYLQDAAEHGFVIKHVILTHFHADFIAGHIELRDRVGAKIYLGRRAEAEFAFTPLGEGDAIEFGNVRLTSLETPGHTPEGISLLVFDLAKSAAEPYAVLTGDTLFIGDVGRPDLLASIGVSADELADMLYDSLHNKLMKLPDATLVYPAHGAGSMCGKQLSSEPFSTIGEQRRYNYALQPMDRAEFKRMITADQPEAPDYFVHDAILNRQDRPSLDESMRESLRPLNLDAVLALQRQGAQMVDVREAADFAAAHLRGAINIGLEGKYAIWCGTVLDKSQPIVVIADEGQQKEAILRLGRIGFDQVRGYLAGGPAALEPRPELVAKVDRTTALALSERLDEEPTPLLLDVRTEKEWQQGHIAGSVNIPLNHLVDRLGEVPHDRPLVVNCQGGYRSSIAASLLQKHGYEHVSDMVGGFKAWSVSQLPFVEEATAAV